MPDEQDMKKLLINHQRRLQKLKEKQVLLGLASPPELLIEIEDIEKEIGQFESNLEALVSGDEFSQTALTKVLTSRLDRVESKIREEDKALFQSFWQLAEDEPLFCAVSTASIQDVGPYVRRMTGFGEIRGYASLVYSLSRAYDTPLPEDTQVFFGDTFRFSLTRTGSWILLGGDDVNPVTDKIIKHFKVGQAGLPIRFSYPENAQGERTGVKQISVQGLPNPFKPIYEELGSGKQQVKYDYGVVARLPNPFAPGRKAFIFAGCHTFGTAAAAKVVADRKILSQLREKCSIDSHHNQFFVLVIRCEVLSQNTFNVDQLELFLSFRRLSRDTLEIISKQECKVEFF
ncbi:MAG: hypothetical protein JXM69_00355 [Anaerolineae bacterium]|nr:hypothetical protein [Anaerolineae bacterium]